MWTNHHQGCRSEGKQGTLFTLPFESRRELITFLPGSPKHGRGWAVWLAESTQASLLEGFLKLSALWSNSGYRMWNYPECSKFIKKLLIIYSTQFSLRSPIVDNDGSLMEWFQVWKGSWQSLYDRGWWPAKDTEPEFWAAQPGSVPGNSIILGKDFLVWALWSLLVFSYCSGDPRGYGFYFFQLLNRNSWMETITELFIND